jgi:hypothetical protein
MTHAHVRIVLDMPAVAPVNAAIGWEARTRGSLLGRPSRAEPLASPTRRDRKRCPVRRFMVLCLAVPLVLLIAVAPVAAATGGGSGTNFSSFTESCSTTGGRQVCTDTNLSVGSNGDGTSSGCLQISTYSNSSNGRFTFISDQFGCNPDVSLTVGSDYSVTLASTVIPVQTCAAHKRSCSGSTNVTVSASDTVVGDVAFTTTISTTVVGGCTYKTTVNETLAQLAGTMTINGSSLAEQGSLDILTETTTFRCK